MAFGALALGSGQGGRCLGRLFFHVEAMVWIINEVVERVSVGGSDPLCFY